MKSEGRILAIDYGSKRIGVAISDPLRLLAHGVTTLAQSPDAVDQICGLISERGVELVVVGMPYSEDGGKGRKAQEVERFIARLRSVTAVPIDTWDESYTSVEAKRAFISGGMKKKKRQQKERVDVMAARLLLQEYLDHRPARKV